MTLEQAGQQFVDLLIDMKLAGRINATQACIISFWAAKAGARGPCSELGKRPGLQSGKYSMSFDKFTQLGPASMDLYQLPIARRLKMDLGRRWDPLPLIPPHEALLDELLLDDSAEQRFQQELEDDNIPLAWSEHESVVEARRLGHRLPRPFSLYLDGVAFNRRDSVLGVWVNWLYSDRKHLLFALRKHDSCDCGCGGWCSIYPLWNALKWSFEALLQGVHPSQRHDGSEWQDSDAGRGSYSGQEMSQRGLCLYVKGDWMELVVRWGFPNWNKKDSPCPHCHSDIDSLHSLRGFSPLGMPSPEKTLAEYLTSCNSVERSIRLAPGLLRMLRASLRYQEGGRFLIADLPFGNLRKGDRFEPTLEHPDIDDIDPDAGPRNCLFWRTDEAYMTKHRNPLLCPESGINMRSFAVDWLHCFSLGLFPHFLGHLVNRLLDADCFRIKPGPGLRMEAGVVHLRHQLALWYKQEHEAGRRHTKVQALVKGMLKVRGEPFLGLHGAECNGFLRFAAQHLLPKYGECLGPDRNLWQQGLDQLVEILNICYSPPGRLAAATCRRFCTCVASHIRLSTKLEIGCRPKHHEAMEMGARPPRACVF